MFFTTKRILTIIAVLAVLAVSGCGQRPAATPPLAIIAGFDVSTSCRPHLAAYATMMARLSGELEADSPTLTLYAVANRSHEFYDDVSDSAEGLQKSLNKQLAKPVEPGTYPDLYWAQAAEKAASTPGPNATVLVLLFGDGDDDRDSPASRAAMRRAAARLAKNPRVKAVLMFGVSQPNWERKRLLFAPLGPTRLRLFTESELSLETLSRAVSQARARPSGTD